MTSKRVRAARQCPRRLVYGAGVLCDEAAGKPWRQIIESNGVKVVHAWSTLDRYDIVVVLDAPDSAKAMRVSAQIARAGHFSA